MEKKIRKRYHSEEAVKKALKIESFRNLTKDKGVYIYDSIYGKGSGA